MCQTHSLILVRKQSIISLEGHRSNAHASSGGTMTIARLEHLNVALSQAGLDAVALNPGPTFAYLTGVSFHLMERPVVLLVAPGRRPALVLPELEKLKVDLFPYPVDAFTYPENPAEWNAAFRKALASLDLDGRKIGVEPRQMRLLEFRHIRSAAS